MAEDRPPLFRRLFACCRRNNEESTDGTPRKTCKQRCIDCLKPDIGRASIEGVDTRERWKNRATFIISTLGMSVGLGQVWRFPTLSYRYGGGAFIIMYGLMLLTLGNAFTYFEMVNGQYSSKNPVFVYDKVPLLQGIGVSMVAYSYFISTYYNHMVSFSFYYLYSSFSNKLPWTYCPEEPYHYDIVACRPFPSGDPNIDDIVCGMTSFSYNHTKVCESNIYAEEQKAKCCEGLEDVTKCDNIFNVTDICRPREYPSSYFWTHVVTKQYREGDPKYGYLGEIIGWLVLTSAIAWLLIYIALYKGLKSLGPFMYIVVPLPYIILIIMFSVTVGQEGALRGLEVMANPDVTSFIDANVWRVATEQAFYSMGVGMGPFISFGSYVKFNNPSHHDALIITIVILLTSILCSMVVFSVLGVLAHKSGKPFEKVVESGPGLVFIVYPESLALIPGAEFFSVIFYIMLVFLGASSVTGLIETVSSAVYDIWPRTRMYKYLVSLGVILSCFLIGLSITSRGGLNVYDAFDTYGGGIPLIPIGALELFAVIYIYGLGRFLEDIAFMTGFYPNRYYRYLWMFGPIIVIVILIYGLIIFKSQEMPKWALIVGWVVFFCIMGPIPIMAIYRLIQYGVQKRIKEVLSPPEDHGPRNIEYRNERSNFSVPRRIF